MEDLDLAARLIRLPEVSSRMRRLQEESLKTNYQFDLLNFEGSFREPWHAQAFQAGLALGLYARYLKDYDLPDEIILESCHPLLVERLQGNLDDQQFLERLAVAPKQPVQDYVLSKQTAKRGLLKRAYEVTLQGCAASATRFLDSLQNESGPIHFIDLLYQPRTDIQNRKVIEYNCVVGPESHLKWLYAPEVGQTGLELH